MKCALVLITGVVSLATLGVATATADPPSNGCPPGMLYWDVAANQANYPNAPAATDNPANGGNGDGFVCAVALGKQRTPSGNQLYLFFDNQLPASYK